MEGILSLDLKSSINVYQNFTGVLIESKGYIKKIVRAHNLVIDVGLEHLADQLLDTPAQSKMSHYAIGTGTTTPVAGDTTLETEIARVTLNPKVRSGKKITFTAAFLPGVGTGNITEGGLLNAASSGIMGARLTFASVPKGPSDTFIVSHEFTFGAV